MNAAATPTAYRNLTRQTVTDTLRRYGVLSGPRWGQSIGVYSSHRADIILVTSLLEHRTEEATAALVTAGYEVEVVTGVLNVPGTATVLRVRRPL